MKLLNKYFNWLQKDVPSNEVERYPEINEFGESSVKGLYIIGDLTGIPLLKLAAENGKKIINYLNDDPGFKEELKEKSNDEILDILIIGAGPAGISAGIVASKLGFSFKIIEAAQKFNTIVNFPKGKPIIAAPNDYEQEADLKIEDGIKESLLEDLNNQLKNIDLPIEEGAMVDEIKKEKNHFHTLTSEKKYKSLRVILAIGKSGNSRMLNVEGEDLPKVYNRLFDPKDATDEDVIVVGGGDTALETAISVSDYAKSTILSYRKPLFSRAKSENLIKIEELSDSNKVKILYESKISKIEKDSVTLVDKADKDIEVPNSMVFTMIGRELPVDFLKRSNIKLEGELSIISKIQFLLLILFSGVLYFGKSSVNVYKQVLGKFDSWTDVAQGFFSFEFWGKFISIPYFLLSTLFSDSMRIWNVTKYINAIVAYLSFILFVVFGIYLVVHYIKNKKISFEFNWPTFKYTYFIFVGIFFAIVFIGSRYFGVDFLDKSQGFWYTGFYSLTILIFGLRRMKVKPTKYIIYQTWTLILIQALPLFILPEFIFPLMGKAGLLGGKDGFMLTQVFPKESYWRSYGFILAWPLNFSNLYNSNITTFWLLFSIFQTFIFIPLIVYKWGKGAYCGWICSCGALAETLGDEYRTLAPHGSKAKKLENMGQWILLFAFVITTFKLISVLYNINIPIIDEKISYTADFFQKFYYISIDVIFAGVLGVGVYFFLSGRVWCRYGCPLAAWMHIVNRFSKYRIFSNKKNCISCNICTKVCHMGIDVMNYANKGIPMNDVECVRCSACVVNCPTQVLTFGSLPKSDPDNKLFESIEIKQLDHDSWKSGLS